jgi:hypothetical protein
MPEISSKYGSDSLVKIQFESHAGTEFWRVSPTNGIFALTEMNCREAATFL